MGWAGGGHCVASLEMAARLECVSTGAPCAQDGARLLGHHRPTGRAFFAVPSASPEHPYTVDYVQVNGCNQITAAPAGAATRWGADVETAAYCALAPESSAPDFAQAGEFFAVGFMAVITLYCSAIGLGSVLRIVRNAHRI